MVNFVVNRSYDQSEKHTPTDSGSHFRKVGNLGSSPGPAQIFTSPTNCTAYALSYSSCGYLFLCKQCT